VKGDLTALGDLVAATGAGLAGRGAALWLPSLSFQDANEAITPTAVAHHERCLSPMDLQLSRDAHSHPLGIVTAATSKIRPRGAQGEKRIDATTDRGSDG
jgi:hypothetical protein